jgi:branched-chain amino acid transport system permease protein
MLQVLLNTITSALLLALVSWSFGIVFRTTKIFHIAHAVVYTLAVYLFIAANKLIDNWFFSVVIALVGVSIIALMMELLVYRPLFKKGVNQNITLISSLGIQILGVNAIALLFGSETRTIDNIRNHSYSYGEIIITKVQFIQFGISVFILVCLYLFFRYSAEGLRIRAVADKHTLASVLGINVLGIRNNVFIIGSIVAGIAAILKATDVGIDLNSGMNVVLSAIVVVILTRSDNIIRIIIFSLLVSFIQNFAEWFFSSQVKDAITYFLLICEMLFYTENILEYKMRIEER